MKFWQGLGTRASMNGMTRLRVLIAALALSAVSVVGAGATGTVEASGCSSGTIGTTIGWSNCGYPGFLHRPRVLCTSRMYEQVGGWMVPNSKSALTCPAGGKVLRVVIEFKPY